MLIGVAVLGLYGYVLPIGILAEDVGGYRPILQGLYVLAVPFFIAVYQAMKLLSYIDGNKAFSDLSVRALKQIKFCAVAVGALLSAGMPYVYVVADRDDAPGVILIGLVIIFAAMVVAVLAAVLQRLLTDAIAIKSENDLTV